jgi:hypothetical protein
MFKGHDVYIMSSSSPSCAGTTILTKSKIADRKRHHIIHHMVYQCSPCHPPHSVPVLAMHYGVHIAFVIWHGTMSAAAAAAAASFFTSFTVSTRNRRRRLPAAIRAAAAPPLPPSSIHDDSGCQSRHATGEKSVAPCHGVSPAWAEVGWGAVRTRSVGD